MADSVVVYSEIRAVKGDKFYSLMDFFDPSTISLTNDDYAATRVEVATATQVTLPSAPGKVTILVPTVAGRVFWLSDAGGSVDSVNTCGVLAAANLPFVLPTKGHEYNSSLTSRLSASSTDIDTVYFYQTTGSTAYVDVYSFS